MNIFQKVKELFVVKAIVEEEIKEAKTMDGNKPGWKKTEFWIKVFTVDLPVLYAGVRGFLPAKTAAVIEIVGLAAFAIFNTVQKAIENYKSVNTPA